MRDLRIEPKASGLGKLLYSEWPNGTIVFDNVHDDVNTFTGTTQPANVNMVHVKATNTQGASVLFRDSKLTGTHTYEAAGTTQWQNPPVYKYERCVLSENPTPETFILTGLSDNAPAGAVPVVDFEDCRNRVAALSAQRGADRLMNKRLNWQVSSSAQPVLRQRSFGNSNGVGLMNTASPVMRLPINSMIRGFLLIKGPGGTADTAWTMTVTNGDGLVLATFNSSSTIDWAGAISAVIEAASFADTDNKRTLTMAVAGLSQSDSNGKLIVEYYA